MITKTLILAIAAFSDVYLEIIMANIKLAIPDAHPVFRIGLINIVADFEDIDVIIEAENGKDLIVKIEKQNPDVILVVF